jgi:trk system potassium uptake protein TrkH
MAVTGFSWIVLAFIAAIPLYLSGHYANYLNALFDGVSGLTTTGATLIENLDHLAYADNMWRFVMHYVGGLGLIVVALSFGLFGRRAGASLYSAEARSEHLVPNIVQTTRFIAKLSLFVIAIATVLLTVICILMGIEPMRAFFHGLCLAVSGFMTGGFTPTSQSITYYHSLGVEIIVMILMVLGSISFTLHSEVWKGRIVAFFRDLEVRVLVSWVCLIMVVLAAALSASTIFSDLPTLLRRGVFMTIASFSTTGMQNITSSQMTTLLSSGAFLTLAVAMAVGGSAGSTSGGIKLFRLGIISKSIKATIKETLAPDSARVAVDYFHLGRRRVSPEIVQEAMGVFALYVITYVIGSLIGIAHGYEASQAIFESVSMTSNGGLTSGILAKDMPVSLEIVYIIQMWAGRLEFVTLLALGVEIIVSFRPKRRQRMEQS